MFIFEDEFRDLILEIISKTEMVERFDRTNFGTDLVIEMKI